MLSSAPHWARDAMNGAARAAPAGSAPKAKRPLAVGGGSSTSRTWTFTVLALPDSRRTCTVLKSWPSHAGPADCWGAVGSVASGPSGCSPPALSRCSQSVHPVAVRARASNCAVGSPSHVMPTISASSVKASCLATPSGADVRSRTASSTFGGPAGAGVGTSPATVRTESVKANANTFAARGGRDLMVGLTAPGSTSAFPIRPPSAPDQPYSARTTVPNRSTPLAIVR